MLFNILTEDVSDNYITSDIINKLKSMSKTVQDVLINNGEWPDIATIRSTNGNCFQWLEAEKLADSENLQILVYAYTSMYAVGSKLDNNVVDTLRTMDIWFHIISELGFRPQGNPFITYVLKYKDFNPEFMRSQLIVLNNLYSDFIFDRNSLENPSSILYNKNIWTLSVDDATTLLEHYFYVSKHRSSYQENIRADGENEVRIKQRVDEHKDKMENYLLFDSNADAANTGTGLEPVYAVTEFVDKFFKKGSSSTDTQKDERDQEVFIPELDSSKKSLIDKLINEGNFKYSDLDSIVSYIKDLHTKGIMR